MILTDRCTYNPDPEAHETKCAICGKPLLYEHVVIGDDGFEISIGIECIKRLNKQGRMKWPRPFGFALDLKRVRADAYWTYQALTQSMRA